MSATHVVSELEERALSKVRRYMFAYILIGQIFYQLDRTNVGFAQLTMGKDLGLKAATFGVAASIFSIAALIMQMPSSLLYEKFRARKWMTFNLAAWGICVVSQTFVQSGFQLTVTRFLLGIFEAGFIPCLFILMNIWLRGKDHGRAASLIMMGLGLSTLIGGPFAGWILGKSFLGLAGWRLIFLIEGILTIIWAFWSLRLLDDDPAKTRWLEPDERKFMVKYLADYQAEKKDRGAITSSRVWSMLKDSRIVLLIFGYFCTGWLAYTVTYFTPTLLKAAGRGVSNQYVGYLAVFPNIIGAVACYYWGRHADRTQERHFHTVVPLLVFVTGVLFYPIAKGSPLLAMFCVCVMQIGNFCFYVGIWPSIQMIAGKEAIAKAAGLINSGSLLGGFLGPVYFGWMIDMTGSTNVGLYTAAGLLVVVFIIMNVFHFRYKAQQRALVGQAAIAGNQGSSDQLL